MAIFWEQEMLFIAWLIGWVFILSKYRILKKENFQFPEAHLSIIIPAMNEEKNIDKVLNSIKKQSYQPYEIIVVNDHSTDKTENIASTYSDIKIISLQGEPPEGWVGKPWACWNGYLNSTGNLLLFLDADVELSPQALESVMAKYYQKKGLLSIWPYQKFTRYYEHFNMPFHLIALSLLSFFSFSPQLQPAIVFGPLLLISRNIYQKIGGHQSVKNRIVEDLEFGKICGKEKIKINSYSGGEMVKFQMYPEGFYQLWEGLTKNIASGALKINFIHFLILFLWFIGIYSSLVHILVRSDFLLFYPLYMLQIYILLDKTGDYNLMDVVLYPLHFLIFLVIFSSSIFKIFILKTVTWKGRKINV